MFDLGDLERRIKDEHGELPETPNVESYLREENPNDEESDEDCELCYHIGIRFNIVAGSRSG